MSHRFIISGGGTGGHIFPAVSIANRLKEYDSESEILFVGAEGKMEMEKVPQAGYKIVGLPIVGLQRQLNLKNIINDLAAPFKLVQSLFKARRIIKEFRPDVAIGVGGYASAPLLWVASGMGIPCVIQEQNGFAGLTNKLLGKRVRSICVAYEGMDRFFPAEKIVLSGNPIRKEVSFPAGEEMVREGLEFYGLHPSKKHIFIVGGSLGCGTLNRAMKKWISEGRPAGEDVEVIWQCGRYYKADTDAFMAANKTEGIQHHDFIARMDLAYAVADLVISRSGASSVSELAAMEKAVIFVPSPNVAEDHQTHNAMALVSKGAAVLVKDAEAGEKLMPEAMALVHDEARLATLRRNIAPLALREASEIIRTEIYKCLK